MLLSHKRIVKIISLFLLNILKYSILMSYLWFCLSECYISFVYLLVQTLAYSVRFWVMCLSIINYWILRFIILISFFIMLIKNFKIWFSNCLWVYVFLTYLRLHSNHFHNGNLLLWSSYSIKFRLRNWFKIGCKWILINWLLDRTTLLLLCVFTKIVFLCSFRRQLR